MNIILVLVVYAYAYYIPKEYTLKIFDASNNLVGSANNPSKYYNNTDDAIIMTKQLN